MECARYKLKNTVLTESDVVKVLVIYFKYTCKDFKILNVNDQELFLRF